MSIKLKRYYDFINESVTVEARDKILKKAEDWAKSNNYEYEISPDSYKDGASFYIRSEYGTWVLRLEESIRKTKIDDYNHSQKYVRDSNNLKWYIHYPASRNSYGFRSNAKAGNFNTFKKLIDGCMEALKTFEFMKKLLFNFNEDINIEKCRFWGKNLKTLSISYTLPKGSLEYSNETKQIISNFKRDSIHENGIVDVNTKSVLYYTLALIGLDGEASKLKNNIDEKLDEKDIDNILKSLKTMNKFKL